MPPPLVAAFVGSDTLLLQCVQRFSERGHRVAAVVTDAPRVRAACAEAGLRCLDAADAGWIETLRSEPIDVLFAVTWLQLLPDAALALPKRFAINFHDAPLPRYAGRNAACWALLHGEPTHGVTWHVLASRADAGAILAQRTFAVAPAETAFTLNAACFAAGFETFGELVERLEAGTLQPVAQDLAQRTWFGRLRRPAALAAIDVAGPAAAVVRLVRALDHGAYPNPLAVAKVRAANGWFAPAAAEIGAAAAGGERPHRPGTVTAVGDGFVQVACADADVRLLRPRCLSGSPLDAAALDALGVREGAELPRLDAAMAAALDALGAAAARDEDAWLAELRDATPLLVPGARPAANGADGTATPLRIEVALPQQETSEAAAALVVAFLARVTGQHDVVVGLATAARAAREAAAPELCVPAPPLRCALDPAAPLADALLAARDAIRRTAARGPLLRELALRHPDLPGLGAAMAPPVRLCLDVGPPAAPCVDAGTLTFAVQQGRVALFVDDATLPEADARSLAARLAVFARAAAAEPTCAVAAVPVLEPAELHRVLHEWNATAAPAPAEPCVHRQFAAQARATPSRVALRCGDDAIDYAGLHRRVESLAGWLRARGVAPGDRVGICMRRGIDLVAAVLATLRAGAAYVPLDPDYPRQRLQLVAEDARLAALVVDAAAAAPSVAAVRIDVDADAEAIAAGPPLADDAATGEHLAYLIHTSGSTGRPNGVMVRHRNVTNFFTGIDAVLRPDPAAEPPPVWLAVTSLSFDISVLELLWTLCRGCTVVVHRGGGAGAVPRATAATAAADANAPTRPVTFSLFYFASDESQSARDKYRLLLDGARFADRAGFEAVWTPERHFHAFGGLYPNPAVAGAALAAITERVAIRAGSCVVTLHHPIRVAEEWSLVDNLSNGRTGVAFAAGWHARDFVLRPETFATRKQALVDGMRQVHALWRGEAVAFPGHDGKPVEVRTLPRPVQPELPTWITVAGNPETYRLAGELGANVLTHLLGQSTEELAGKIAVYRQARRDAGHAGEGRVTLMLHTFVGDSDEQVREHVRGPMKEYLRSSLDLVKQAAWSFPAFRNQVSAPAEMDALLQGGMTPADFDALLDFSFERYYHGSALFGTVAGCERFVDSLRALGVDEIACLVDFGVPTEVALAHLPHLQELQQRCERATAERQQRAAAATAGPAAHETVPELMLRHGVTHLQGTPSLLGMLLLDPASRGAFRELRQLLVGGEALPVPLARELASLVPEVVDVYGPTETTVWSTSMRVGGDDPVPIGRPLANQRVYVLDPARQPVPIGSEGQLWIGGAGVTAGYFERPELTAQRFAPDPFAPAGAGATMYATGDLARWRADGVLEYLGRLDHQVKIRGHRIEVGEIETALLGHPRVRECAVAARTDGGETRLVAWFVPRADAPTADELREHLRARLPEFMVPGHFVQLAELPRTPNLKIDRKALPSPDAGTAAARARGATIAAAADATEDAILAIWKQALGTDDVGVEDNFFDSGGHSILAIRVHREIQQRLGVDLPVTDLFRFPTVRTLAAHLQQGAAAPTAAQQALERVKNRRNLLRRG